MLVAYGVEFGDDGKVAMPPRVIGNVETAIGCGILTHPDGSAVQVMPGDPVYQGDAIETGSDGRIEIRFIDGTVFKLSGDSRVVLHEFVCDSDRADSALFAVTKGTFAFVAGRVARTGSLWVDTPVGSIRGWTHTGGFGMLSLAALVFSFVSEAHAADPDVAFPDDDRITYKDFEHGVFELVTKEAIPRHIIVEDPGQTIVLSKRGSSVSVNQVANTPARMEQLHADQQDVLANFNKAFGPNGSSTPPFFNLQPLLHPINFIQADPTNPQNSLPPLEGAVFHFAELPIVFIPPPPPIPPTLNLGMGPTEVDTVVFDNFSATRGTFSASSAKSDATLTFGVSGGTAVNTVTGGVTYNLSSAGQFGTLLVNSTSGAYTFVPNNDAINALKANTTQSFVITVSDGSLAVDQTFNITIVGADDAAIISGTAAGSVVGTGAVTNASPGLPIATGALADIDVDDPANTFAAVNSPTRSAGGYGTFTMTAAGVWTYTLDNANSAVRALNVGGTLTDTFTVTSIDGTPQVVTITVHGPLIGTTGTTPSLTLSETHLTATALDDNIAGSAPDATLTTISGNFSTAFASVQGIDGATISYALSIAGGNGTPSGLIDSHTGLADVLVLNGNSIEGHVGTTGGALAFTITLDPTTGLVTFTETRAVTQPFGTSPDRGEGASLTAGIVTLTATVTDRDGGFQSISLDLGGRLTVTDDGPSIAATGTAPALTLSETHLTATTLDDNIAGSAPDATLTTTSGDFSTAFRSVQGADGATTSYALSIAGGNGTPSGLIDSHTGLADVLVLNGNSIEGRVGTTGGALAFTITLDPTTGIVTFTETRAVTQPFGTSPDGGEGATLTAGIVNLVATITDKDGDLQTASLDLGKQLTIADDGPSIARTGTAPSLTLSETHLTATALDDNIAGSAPDATLMTTSGNFSTAFTSMQGADEATIGYALSIAGGNGTASGLIDSHTGLADVLVLNGNSIEGHVGTTGGALAFTITVDPTTGLVTFTETRAVTQPFGTSPDGAQGASLTAGIVTLTATITDKDGDFQTASVDLGKQLTITDDGPTIGGFENAVIAAQDNQIVNGTYDVKFGADGDSAMLVAVHNGAVGSTGYNLATSSLGGGITSVHVTGNGDDYTFYYSTHAVNGGVELDAYLTDTNGTLTNPYFTLLINPDGTYSFDLESIELLKQVTVSGANFGASGGGTPSLIAPDGQLVITGADNSGHALDVKASSNGIAVGDTGLQMDPNEDLQLTFLQEQSQISFILTQWQGSGTAEVTFKVLDGTTDVHDFNINIPKPSGGTTNIAVQETSNAALIDTFSFDSATETYTLYVGQIFDQVQVNYDQAVAGNATFAVNNITYNEKTTIPSTDLLFDVSAVDGDGDSAATSLQVNVQGSTGATVAASLTSASISSSGVLVGGGNDATTSISGTTTGSVIEATGATPGTPIATTTLTNTGVDNPPDALTTVGSPKKSDRGYGNFAQPAAGGWAYAPDNNNAVNARNTGDALTDMIVNGFGAVLLTGGTAFGNPSSATQFASGSDKIDLTAFGALAFVNLASASASVPAHAIAWLVHGATNETIVYVNPTDHPLSIGDSGLVEIHLHGVSNIQASDFILAPEAHILAASASIDAAALTAWEATLATTTDTDVSSTAAKTPHMGHGIDAAPDKAAWIAIPTDSIEHAANDTAITVPGGQSVDLPQFALLAPMETGFNFDHMPAFDRTDATQSQNWILPTDSHWQIDSGTGSAGDEDHGGSMDGAAHGHSADVDSKPGDLKASENAGGNHSNSSDAGEHGPPPGHGAGAHDGGPSWIDVDSDAALHPGNLKGAENGVGNHSDSSEAGEHGPPPGHGPGVHDVEPSSIDADSSAALHPGGPKASENGAGNHASAGDAGANGPPGYGAGRNGNALGLGDSFHFKDEASGSGVSGVAAPDHLPASDSHHDDAAGVHGPIAAGSQALDLPLPLPADDLGTVPDVGKDHVVAHVPHDLIV